MWFLLFVGVEALWIECALLNSCGPISVYLLFGQSISRQVQQLNLRSTLFHRYKTERVVHIWSFCWNYLLYVWKRTSLFLKEVGEEKHSSRIVLLKYFLYRVLTWVFPGGRGRRKGGWEGVAVKLGQAPKEIIFIEKKLTQFPWTIPCPLQSLSRLRFCFRRLYWKKRKVAIRSTRPGSVYIKKKLVENYRQPSGHVFRMLEHSTFLPESYCGGTIAGFLPNFSVLKQSLLVDKTYFKLLAKRILPFDPFLPRVKKINMFHHRVDRNLTI